VKVFEETKAISLQFKGERPISAEWQSKSGTSGKIVFDYLIDASGREGIMSTKYLKNRVFTQGLKNLASWGYWTGGATYGIGTRREGAPVFEALTGKLCCLFQSIKYSNVSYIYQIDETGWVWYIPLSNGTVSVGAVVNEEQNTLKRKALREQNPESTLKDYYLSQVKLAPTIARMLENATFVSQSIRSASDYSYAATVKSGPGFRLVGDAAGARLFEHNRYGCLM
jgi:flavine halogenase